MLTACMGDMVAQSCGCKNHDSLSPSFLAFPEIFYSISAWMKISLSSFLWVHHLSPQCIMLSLFRSYCLFGHSLTLNMDENVLLLDRPSCGCTRSAPENHDFLCHWCLSRCLSPYLHGFPGQSWSYFHQRWTPFSQPLHCSTEPKAIEEEVKTVGPVKQNHILSSIAAF